ncbi:hypothetical protein, partial [Stenotrophomonas maltophilia]|uniref:hypothetical protein n=1 Tax=Stenotrophomonas maltophilia TaxID=40324 RepID=UPI0019541C64
RHGMKMLRRMPHRAAARDFPGFRRSDRSEKMAGEIHKITMPRKKCHGTIAIVGVLWHRTALFDASAVERQVDAGVAQG